MYDYGGFLCEFRTYRTSFWHLIAKIRKFIQFYNSNTIKLVVAHDIAMHFVLVISWRNIEKKSKYREKKHIFPPMLLRSELLIRTSRLSLCSFGSFSPPCRRLLCRDNLMTHTFVLFVFFSAFIEYFVEFYCLVFFVILFGPFYVQAVCETMAGGQLYFDVC